MALETLNLSGIKAGDSLQISVSQNGLTAGPYSIGSWGGEEHGGSITVSAIHRSYRYIAPDSIRFVVDLSSSNFDTTGPVGDEVYDARLHDLIYLWDMGDPGTWTAPENVLSAWKNRNVAKGPSVRHLYRNPGNYTVSVVVIEPSSGKTARAETTITVSDPQDFYGNTNTIYVNNVGDSDFSDVPAGVPSANKINIDSLTKILVGGSRVPDTTWGSFQGGSAKRWRFKRGGSWEISVYLDGLDRPDVMFDDYGDPNEPKPEFKTLGGATGDELFMFRMGYGHDSQGIAGRLPTQNPPDLRLRNIKAQGIFDSTVTPAVDPDTPRAVFMWLVSAFNLIMADCDIDGFGGSNFTLKAAVNDFTGVGKAHWDNCTLSNFGGQYPISISNNATEDSSVALTGVKWQQPGDALTSKSGYMGSRSPARLNSPQFIHIRGCDSFITEADLTHFQIMKNAQNDGALVNIHSCSAEGGSAFMDTDGLWSQTPQERMHVHNIIVDSVIYVGGWGSFAMFEMKSTGATIRNCLYIVPPVLAINNGSYGLLLMKENKANGSMLPDFVADAPVRVYNCTYFNQRTAAQNKGNPSHIISERSDDTSLTGVLEANNILHLPYLSIDGDPDAPFTAFAPLSENVLWTPRMLGRRDPETLVLDTSYATPLNAVKDSKPLLGSAALGAALNGDVSYMDITLQKRPEPPSMGAWEAD